jgi:hypothetical protein
MGRTSGRWATRNPLCQAGLGLCSSQLSHGRVGKLLGWLVGQDRTALQCQMPIELPRMDRRVEMACCMGCCCMLLPSVPCPVFGSTHDAHHPCTHAQCIAELLATSHTT